MFCFRSLKYRIILKRSERILLCTCLKVKVLIARLCLTLRDPMDCSPPGSSVRGILQAGILEWVTMPSSRASSQPRDQTPVSCIVGRFFRAAWLGLGNVFFFNLQTKAALQLNYISPTIWLGICCKDACSVIATRSRKQTHSEGQCGQWSAVHYTGGPKAEPPLSQGPRPAFVKIFCTPCVCV